MCARPSIGKQAAFEELCSVRVCISSLYLVELFVEFPRFVSYLLFLVLCPVLSKILQIKRVRMSFEPLIFSKKKKRYTGMRLLEVSDLHFVG